MAEPLTIAPALRPWLKAGLGFLLLDSEERAAALKNVPARQGREQSAPAASRAPAAPRPAPFAPSTEQAAPVMPGGPNPEQPAVSRELRPVEAQALAARAGSGSSEEGFSAQNTRRILPPEAWPPAWQALKNRKPLPPRPLVFWTYAGLGDDLMGVADPARQQVIVRMLTALRHPGGTHVFWPYALPSSTPDAPSAVSPAPESEASLFWSGVALLRPRALLLFGSEARDALNMPKTLLPFCQERIDGQLVIQLPQPASLLSPDGNDDAFRRAHAFLSRLLSFCTTR